MPADAITLSGILDVEPNENWEKFKKKPRSTYTPPDWLTGKKAFDHSSAWASGLKDSVASGDLGGVGTALFTPPVNFADFLPSPEEISSGEDDLVRMGYQDENSSKWKKRLMGGGRGIADFASNVFLAPGNVALGGAMSGLKGLSQAASSPIVRSAAKLARAGASGKFAVDAGRGAIDSGQRFALARDAGDDVGMGSAAVEGIGNTAMLAAAGTHAVTEGVHATSEMLAASPELQKIHAQITGIVTNPAELQTAMNAIVTAMAANGGDVYAAAAPVLRSLYTWRANPHDVIDPANWGKGKPGAEQRRYQNDRQNFQPRWSAWDTPEANESGFGPNSPRPIRHHIQVPDNFYDLQKDPEGFIQRTGDITLAEKAVKEAGYEGYYYDNGAGNKVYAGFNPAPAVEIAKFQSYDQPPEVIKPLQIERATQTEAQPVDTPELALARKILESHNANGGSSFHLENGDLSGSNKYMVSIYPEASEILNEAPTPERIAEYIQKYQELLQDPNVAIGTWADDGKHYLDLSAALDDRDLAFKLGRKYNQKGIGQLVPGGFDYHDTGGTGEGIGFEAPPIAERLRREMQPPAPGEAPPAVEPQPASSPRSIIRVPHAFMRLRANPPAEKSGPVLVPEAARQLHDLSVKKYGTVDNPKDAVSRFLKMAEPEVRYQIEQPQSGLQWYEDDIGHMEQGMKRLHPELEKPEKMGIFKALLAITSNGQKPNTNLPLAEKLYAAYKETGKIPERQQDGKGWTQRGADNALKIGIINKLITDHGEANVGDWLLQKHTVAELRKYNPAVSGKAADTAYGYRVMGPKLGIFGLNINGVSENLTKDMWWSRTWNRYLGTLIENDSVVESPRNDSERRVMDQAAAKLSKKVGLPISKIQAVLWYYEKQLYEALGARTESESFKDVTDRILRQRGLLGEADGAGGPADGGVRADAGAREGAGGTEGGKGRDGDKAPSRPAHPALKKKKAR